MKHILHVFRAGLTGGVCIALLTACQDGGRGAFKSRHYTLAEICEWQKANNKASSCDSTKTEIIETKVLEKAPAAPPPIESVVGPIITPRNEPSVFQRPQPTAPKAQDTNPGSAQGQTIVETVKSAPVTASRDQFLAEVENRILQKDSEATKLFKGLDINVNVDRLQKTVLVEIDALAIVAGSLRLVQVKSTPVKFETASTIGTLDYELRDELNGPVLPKSEALTIAATCAVETCEDIRILMEFKIGSGQLVAAFKLQHVGDDKYEIKGSNLVSRESFKKALESLVKPVASEKPEPKESAPTDSKATDSKPADSKVLEEIKAKEISKPAEVEKVKPVEAKPEVAKPVETKAIDSQPSEKVKPTVENKPADQAQAKKTDGVASKNQTIRNRVAAAKNRERKSASKGEKPKVPAVQYKDTVDI